MINLESDEISSDRTGSWGFSNLSLRTRRMGTYSMTVELEEEFECIDEKDLDCHIE